MLILHTDSLLGYGLHHIFHFAKQAGYDGIELGMSGKLYDTLNPDYLKKLSEEVGVRVIAIETPIGVTKEKMELAHKLAEAVQASVITVQPPAYFDYNSTAWIKTNVPKLRNLGNRRITIVNTADEKTFGVWPKSSMATVADWKDFHQMTVDLSNLTSRHIDPLHFLDRMKEYAFHIHFCNYRGDKDHALPQTGRVPMESILKKLFTGGYNGSFSLKVRPDELMVGRDDALVLGKLQEVKAFFTQYFSA